MKKLPHTLLTLSAELTQQVIGAPRGASLYERERDGIRYHYAKVPVGSDRLDVFIGKVGDPEAEREASELRRAMEIARGRRKLVSILRREGLAAPYKTIGATLDSLEYSGLFKAGAVLVGTAAYMMSEPLVGHFLPRPTLMTGDPDPAAADLALTAEPPETLEAILKRADPTFEPVIQLDPRRPASRFRTADGFYVDLVTPVRRRSDSNPVSVRALGAGAAPLQHIDWLIADPVTTVALWGAGVAINVPQPARFAVHKLILAQRRRDGMRLKRQKDLAQADAMIEALLGSDRFALEDALEDARARGLRGWAQPIDRSLTELGRSHSDLSRKAVEQA